MINVCICQGDAVDRLTSAMSGSLKVEKVSVWDLGWRVLNVGILHDLNVHSNLNGSTGCFLHSVFWTSQSKTWRKLARFMGQNRICLAYYIIFTLADMGYGYRYGTVSVTSLDITSQFTSSNIAREVQVSPPPHLQGLWPFCNCLSF